jgi:hypothetical protein
MSPNTPKAIASGRMVRSACATSGAFVREPAACPRSGVIFLMAETTAASCRIPPSSCNET